MSERELLKRIASDKNLLKCYQCGTCVGGCPVSRTLPQYNPRKILESLITGEYSDLLSDKLVWLCAYCHSCLERCPQRIGLSHVFVELKNASFKTGNVPQGILEEVMQLVKSGRTAPLTPAVERRRSELNLPPLNISIDVGEIQRIVEGTHLDSLLKAARRKRGGKDT